MRENRICLQQTAIKTTREVCGQFLYCPIWSDAQPLGLMLVRHNEGQKVKLAFQLGM